MQTSLVNHPHSKTWEDMMVFYGEAHQSAFNLATHVIGVPIISASVLAACSLIALGPLSLGWVLLVTVALYYLYLDRVFGLTILPFMLIVMTLVQYAVAALSTPEILTYAAIGFFGGYGLQFVGHGVEGKKPSLMQNPIMAMVVAPLFMIAEIYQVMGLRSDLFSAVERRLVDCKGD